ncbi:hypothetical protein ANAPC5_01470 [Anaplasma phagocytophilum]|nr:hypothetical protein ANAPC5_01470 [Anaplasma phagocytophilum]
MLTGPTCAPVIGHRNRYAMLVIRVSTTNDPSHFLASEDENPWLGVTEWVSPSENQISDGKFDVFPAFIIIGFDVVIGLVRYSPGSLSLYSGYYRRVFVQTLSVPGAGEPLGQALYCFLCVL